MTAAIIAIITALISFFGSKKAGASDGEAALIAAGAGAGAYYVTTSTEWGQGVVSDIENWVGLKDTNGDPYLNSDGSQVEAPKGATVQVDENGQPKRDANGNIMWKLVDEAGKTLQSWGGVGTASVIGAGAVAANADDLPSWLLPAGLGLVALMLLK